MMSTMQLEPRADIARFLKGLRSRVSPDTKVLGVHERLNSRRGRAVTQEELAEAIGVSRGWYARLENGAPIQPSVSMLSRLADALAANPGERTTLFRLAIPALQSAIAETMPGSHENACPACGLSRSPYRPSASSAARSIPSSAPSVASVVIASGPSWSRSDAMRMS
jgi:transcriptional regulator with XRE-family HTH domain